MNDDRTPIRRGVVFPLSLWAITVLSIQSGPLLGDTNERPFTVDGDVVYGRFGDEDLRADVYRPNPKHFPGLRPGVVMIHGGAWMSGSKLNVAVHAMKLARQGYVVMAVDYRLAPKYKFPAQLEDCQAALKWFGQHAADYRVDVNRIAAYGYSAGGHLACLLGVRQRPTTDGNYRANEATESPQLKAIVAGGAPCEFREVPESSKFLSYWLGGTRAEIPDVYRAASPTAFVTDDAPPVFFFHGEKDHIVPVRSARSLQLKLQEQGVETEMLLVENGGHLAAFFDGQAIHSARKFLDRHLNPKGSSEVQDNGHITAEQGTSAVRQSP